MKRGWCPTLDRPMETGDGFLVRVKPPAARLDAAAAHALAAAAEAYGNGILELTQRGNVQIRGLAPDSAPRFAAAMRQAGLALPEAAESRRAVIPPALLDDDPGLAPGAAAFTAAIEHACQTDPRLAVLPPKFAIAIEAGGILADRPVAADLVAWTNGVHTGLRRAERMPAPPPIGLLPYPGTEDAAFGLAPPFGQMTAAQLRQAAELARSLGTTLRVTPWRVLLLGRIPVAAAPGRFDPWITDPADPRLRVTACPGAPSCASATVPARADAARLVSAGRVHVSGCAKGCAHPMAAPVTLVGRDGRYDLVRNGRACDPPFVTGLTLEEAQALL